MYSIYSHTTTFIEPIQNINIISNKSLTMWP